MWLPPQPGCHCCSVKNSAGDLVPKQACRWRGGHRASAFSRGVAATGGAIAVGVTAAAVVVAAATLAPGPGRCAAFATCPQLGQMQAACPQAPHMLRAGGRATLAIASHFATPIYNRPLHPAGSEELVAALNRDIAVEARQYLAMDDAGRRWSDLHYRGGYTSFASLKALHRMSSTFDELRRRVDRHVRAFAEYLELDQPERLSMTDCWVNQMPQGTSHGLHLHPCSTISGTYYVETPEGCSGLRFEDPRLDRMMAAPPRREGARKRNQQLVEYPARAGDVVLFESWLRHSVAANRASEIRLSVSFNYHWC